MEKLVIYIILLLIVSACMTDKKHLSESQFISVTIGSGDFKLDMIWDNDSNQFVKDSAYLQLESNFPSYRSQLIQGIKNEQKCDANACGKSVDIGQLNFLLIHQINQIPVYAIFGIQFDYIPKHCNLPEGLMSFVHENRGIVINKLYKYYE